MTSEPFTVWKLQKFCKSNDFTFFSLSPFPKKRENKEVISFFQIKAQFYSISGLYGMSVPESYITSRYLIEDINFQGLDADT